MSATTFDVTDGPYFDWVHKHADSFVVNTTRYRSRYAVLHAADCYHITQPGKRHTPNAFTGEKYIKICSDHLLDLVEWVTEERPAAHLRPCKSCNPDAEIFEVGPDSYTVELTKDLDDLKTRDDLNPTERDTLVKARLGQGQLRAKMLKIWGGRCAVTGCNVETALIASHAKPWSCSDDRERLDANNGLPLVASLDRLFDQYLIAFEPATGEMLVSNDIDEANRKILGIPRGLRQALNEDQARFLGIHLEVFSGNQAASDVDEDMF